MLNKSHWISIVSDFRIIHPKHTHTHTRKLCKAVVLGPERKILRAFDSNSEIELMTENPFPWEMLFTGKIVLWQGKMYQTARKLRDY